MRIYYPHNSVFFQVIWLPRAIRVFFTACYKLARGPLTGLTYEEQATFRTFVAGYPEHLTKELEGGRDATEVSRNSIRDARDEDGEHSPST